MGAIFKYHIDTGVCKSQISSPAPVWLEIFYTGTDITPVSGSDLYFGFGGVAVDLQKNGTIMVAALNSWWPDGQMFRSLDGGASWSPLWTWGSYPQINKFYSYDDTNAPWFGPNLVDTTLGDLQIGWMMECKSCPA